LLHFPYCFEEIARLIFNARQEARGGRETEVLSLYFWPVTQKMSKASHTLDNDSLATLFFELTTRNQPISVENSEQLFERKRNLSLKRTTISAPFLLLLNN
jgi:hypothetical protein